MLKDKWVRWFYVFLILMFVSIYYTGEERNRRIRELGFEVCEINGIETWSLKCPKETNFLSNIGVCKCLSNYWDFL